MIRQGIRWLVVGAVALISISWFALAATAAQAAPGDLDPSFGTNGKVRTDFRHSTCGCSGEDLARDVAIQPDGKVIAVGSSRHSGGPFRYFTLARYNLDGTLDPSFGQGGRVASDFGDVTEATAIAIQRDGKIVVAGQANLDFAIARYNPDGSPDRSFGGGDGLAIAFERPGPYHHIAYDLALQPDGKIVAVGFLGGFVLARFKADGSLDETFSTTHTPNNTNTVALQPDGKILAAGQAQPDGAFATFRYNPDGGPDGAFGSGGVARAFAGSIGNAVDLDLQPDGRIVAAGESNAAEGFALVRYSPDGTLDSSFGAGGQVTTDFPGKDDHARALALHPGGKIAVAGHVNSDFSVNEDFALARYRPDGTLDEGFGSGGKVTTNIVPVTEGGRDSTDEARGLAIQQDGKLVVAGSANDGNQDFALARYDGGGLGPPGPPDTTAPQTTITSGPAGTTTDKTPTFGFSSSEPGSSFECRIDSGAFTSCASPFTPFGLGNGVHTFQVRATDSARNTDPTPATRSFIVGALPPPPSEVAELAMRYRPWLRFHSAERWRPLEIGSFVAEPHRQVCRRGRGPFRRGRRGRRERLLCERMTAGRFSEPTYNSSEAYISIPDRQSPYQECRAGPRLDCDIGNRSSIYYNAYRVGRLLYLDYWWFLRFNDHYSNVSDHQGDWEGVTAIVDLSGPAGDRLLDVAFAAHLPSGQAWRYLALPLSYAEGPRVNVYVSDGGHGAYPRPCSTGSTPCNQTSDSGDYVSTTPETGFNGGAPWGNNPSGTCRSSNCLRPIPKSSTIIQQPRGRDWAGWLGRWGRQGSPESPGAQDRFLRPWDTRRTRRDVFDASGGRRAGNDRQVPGCDGSWFGPFVQAFVCDPRALRATYASQSFDTPPSFTVRASQRGARAGAARGVAQVLGKPLKPNQKIAISGAASRTAALRLRITDGPWTAIARVRQLGLQKGGTTTIRATRIAGKPALFVRAPGKPLRRINVKRARLPRPQAVWAERRRKGVAVRFVSTPKVRAVVELRRNRRGGQVSRRTLAIRGRGQVRRVTAIFRTRSGALFARVRLFSRGHRSSPVVVPIRRRVESR